MLVLLGGVGKEHQYLNSCCLLSTSFLTLLYLLSDVMLSATLWGDVMNISFLQIRKQREGVVSPRSHSWTLAGFKPKLIAAKAHGLPLKHQGGSPGVPLAGIRIALHGNESC